MYLNLTIDEYIKKNNFFIEHSIDYLEKIKSGKCISKSAFELSKYHLKKYLEIDFYLHLIKCFKTDEKTEREKFILLNKFMGKMDYELKTCSGFINGDR